jgi:hypothetical protein
LPSSLSTVLSWPSYSLLVHLLQFGTVLFPTLRRAALCSYRTKKSSLMRKRAFMRVPLRVTRKRYYSFPVIVLYHNVYNRLLINSAYQRRLRGRLSYALFISRWRSALCAFAFIANLGLSGLTVLSGNFSYSYLHYHSYFYS